MLTQNFIPFGTIYIVGRETTRWKKRKKNRDRTILLMSQPVPEPKAPSDIPPAQGAPLPPIEVQAPAEAAPANNPPSDGEGSSDDDDEDCIPAFASDEEALAARQVALCLYNDGKYNEALDLQCAVVQHFTTKLGQTNAGCGLYYLDYGLSLLRSIQCRDSSAAAVEPLDVEAIETAFINLDTARVCFEKAEARDPENEEIQLRLAEVHNAIAQVHIEQEDFDKALMEYESELAIYRSIATQHPGKIVAALFGIADCYLKECDFDEGEKRLMDCIEEVGKYPAGTIAAELVEELRDLHTEAVEMKGGKYKEVQEAVRAQFSEQAEEVPTAEEFAHAQAKNKNPFVSDLPGDNNYPSRSIPLALSGVPLRENSNSLSVSMFPPIGSYGSNSNSGPVHVVVARKKPKQQQVALAGAVSLAFSDSGSAGSAVGAATVQGTAGTSDLPAAGVSATEEPAMKKARTQV